MLLFPSYLYHRILPFDSSEIRISVAFDEAEAAYRRAIDLAPHLAGSHFNLGNLLRQRESAPTRARSRGRDPIYHSCPFLGNQLYSLQAPMNRLDS